MGTTMVMAPCWGWHSLGDSQAGRGELAQLAQAWGHPGPGAGPMGTFTSSW